MLGRFQRRKRDDHPQESPDVSRDRRSVAGRLYKGLLSYRWPSLLTRTRTITRLFRRLS